ncbi:MAG: DUF362 domain-containing protein, partial [Gammaproteobacteria bacterium]
MLSRREVLKLSGMALAGRAFASKPPLAPVAIGRCRTYGKEMVAALDGLFDKIGGLRPLVSGKTVAVKVNLTGGVRPVLGGRDAGRTYHVHPNVVLACCQAFARAGARRVRLLEGWDPARPAEDFLGECAWDLAAIRNAGTKVEFENTNNKGSAKSYSRLKVRHGGYIYPSFEFNHSYEDCDFFVSLAKMKNHYTAGITLALKNCFGTAPSAFYGDDAGTEAAKQSRGRRFHRGSAQPPAPAAAELDPSTSRDPGHRVTRITVDLISAIHPIGLSIIDGIESVQGGEGPWIKPIRLVEPGLLVVGTNPVCTDAVTTAVMGYDPAGEFASPPFYRGDNTMTLAEAAGIG